MIAAPVPRSQWGSLEARIERLRADLSAGVCASEVADELGVDLQGCDRNEWETFQSAILEVQIKSKLWLLDELFARLPSQTYRILVLGGWCGVLPWIARLTGRGTQSTWISIDFDPAVDSIGRRVFGGSVPNVEFLCQNIHSIDYQELAGDSELIVINTICEHLPAFADWRLLIPRGTLTLLQSNNFRGCPDHVNCVDGVGELVNAARLGQVIYQGSLALSLFTRYMVIGRA